MNRSTTNNTTRTNGSKLTSQKSKSGTNQKPANQTTLPKIKSNTSLNSISESGSNDQTKRPSSNSSDKKSQSSTSAIVIDDVVYDDKKIQELLTQNAILNEEILSLQTKLKERDFQIRSKDIEINDLRQNYDKVKSVLAQKNNKLNNEMNGTKVLSRIQSAHRSKKQGVSAESLSSQKVQSKTFEKPAKALQLIIDALKGCGNDFMSMLKEEQIKKIAACMYEKRVKASCHVIREKDVGEAMYVLAEGKLSVSKDGKLLRTMYPGELFGELAVLQNCLRTASVTALTDCAFWTIDRQVYQAILQKSNCQQLEEYQSFVNSIPLFKEFSADQKNKIVDSFNLEKYSVDEVIIKEGDDGHTFYIIKKGEVKIEKLQPNKKPEILRVLKTGDYFGEQALIKNEIRTASAIATTEVELLTLDQDDFTRLVGQLNEIKTKSYAYKEELDDDQTKRKNPYQHIKLEDLEKIATLGLGGFGRVELVRHKTEKKDVFALKSLKKTFIVKMKQQEHVYSERNILLELNSEFICQLYRTYRDNKYVYMLMEVCLGGEVWTILRNNNSFNDKTTKFILACVIFAIEYLHSKHIIYRDLKPENLLLDKSGYIKLCDFGFAKKIALGRKTYTFCGTPEYVAPEIILNRGHDFAADLWSLGILIIELLTGSPPFSSSDPMKIYNLILKGFSKVEFSSKVSKVAQSLIKSLCKATPSERLGYGKGGISDIRKHRFLDDINWKKIEKREEQPPIIPKIENDVDTRNFDSFSPDTEKIADEMSGWDLGFEN